MMIVSFWGAHNENGYLSNFFNAPIWIDGIKFPTTEHFFQAKKFEGTRWFHVIRECPTPAAAARLGKSRALPLRKDWEEIKEDVMLEALRAKFSQHPTLLRQLLATGDAELVEDSPYDSYWGVGRNGTGKNRLGILLMQIREEFKQKTLCGLTSQSFLFKYKRGPNHN